MAASNHDLEVLSLEEDNDLPSPNIPDRETCQKLVEEFASVTQTDEALAQCFLQDHEWKLDLSLNAFYESQKNDMKRDEELLVTFDSSDVCALSRVPLVIPGNFTIKPPNHFTYITWNLDGLDERNLKKRTKAVSKIIQTEKPDIIFLQEVIAVTFSYLEEHLPDYAFIPGATEDYFVATLLLRTTVYFDGHFIHPFPNSRMGRNLLFVDCHIGSLKLRLLNAHLESTADFAQERKAQLRSAFNLLTSGTAERTSIFGGDLNLRDKEVMEVKIPHGVFDLWESCGRRKECKFTWDTVRNTNKSFPGRFKPRTRFDRVYLHQSDPPSVNPKHFGLVGIEKVAGTQSFPSDHWGIIVHFDIVNQRANTSTPPPSHSNLSAPDSSRNFRNVPESSHSGSLNDPDLLLLPSCSGKTANRTVDCFDISESSIECLESPNVSAEGRPQISDLESNSRKEKRKFSLVELD